MCTHFMVPSSRSHPRAHTVRPISSRGPFWPLTAYYTQLMIASFGGQYGDTIGSGGSLRKQGKLFEMKVVCALHQRSPRYKHHLMQNDEHCKLQLHQLTTNISTLTSKPDPTSTYSNPIQPFYCKIFSMVHSTSNWEKGTFFQFLSTLSAYCQRCHDTRNSVVCANSSKLTRFSMPI